MKVTVVGAGLSGLTMAYLFNRLEKADVTIVEASDHIGGNCLDRIREDGAIVPIAGAHIFHTNSQAAWRFMNTFSPFNTYIHKVKVQTHIGASAGLTMLDWPITLRAICQIYERDMTPSDARKLIASQGKKWIETQDSNFETKMLAQLGPKLYEIFVKPYTEKMWGVEAHTLSASLAGRITIRFNNERPMFLDKYQGLPIAGYSHLFNVMLSLSRAKVRFKTKVNESTPLGANRLVITSPVDEWFQYKLGHLTYRGMRFEAHRIPTLMDPFILPFGTINTPHPSAETLRIEEPKHYYQQEHLPFTYLVYNYASGETRYYPFPSVENESLAVRYRAWSGTSGNVFAGRLGTYRYLDMDKAILLAFKKFEEATGKNVERELFPEPLPEPKEVGIR